MKLLLDQGLPRTTAAILSSSGIDTVHAGDAGLARSADVDIMRRARNDGRLIVTLDSDFHTIMALSMATNPSVIRIRIEGLKAEEMAGLIGNVIEKTGDDLTEGAIVSVTENRIRVRSLPVTSKNE